MRPLRVWSDTARASGELGLQELAPEIELRRRGGALEIASGRPLEAASGRPLEIEIGFGKGRYLLARAAALPETTFLGIESAAVYWTQTTRQAQRRALSNVVTVCGDALYVLGVCLDREIAAAMHVYFPDPWPKTRHQRRRLLDPSTVDLVVGALEPGGVLYFATDHADYGDSVEAVLERYPAVAVERVEGPWPDGPRTHYESKYEAEARPILRLVVTRVAGSGACLLHPDGVAELTTG